MARGTGTGRADNRRPPDRRVGTALVGTGRSATSRGRSVWSALGLPVALLFGFGVRLVLGLRTPLDATEATLGLSALHILHGQLPVMDPDGQYQGATDAYLVAPFVAIFGASLGAIRVALACIGALTVLCAWWFGRIAFRRPVDAVVGALAVAVFPLFGVYWSTRLYPGSAELLLLEMVCISIAALVGWGRGRQKRWWLLLGLASGIALWSDLLFVCVIAAIALALLLRGPRIGWETLFVGAATAVAGGIVGVLPWLVANVPNLFFGVRAIPRSPVSLTARTASLVHEQVPILAGFVASCGHTVFPAVAGDIAVAVLLLALLWTRRRTVEYLVTGHWTGISQIDLMLLVIPVTVALVVLGDVNGEACAAQSLIPVTLPLALGAAAILVERTRWRVIAAVAAAAWLAVSAITATRTLEASQALTTSGTAIPSSLAPGLALIQQHHPGAMWADYSLSRLLSYYSGDTLAIGEYGGYSGFINRQQQAETALDPSWVFVAGDPNIAAFVKTCAAKSIRYTEYSRGGLDLYTALTGPLEPGDVFTGAEAQTS
jgi:4-amino-4-deoxy-L-arabinose transferase-like glycosyltransferase